jgi:hypothetical protein
MDNGQPRQDPDLLQRERKARGELRDAYLEAARELARRENAQARERSLVESRLMKDGIDADHEAGHQDRQEADGSV